MHRAELVGAFFNGVFLLALALSIFLQSLERFVNIEALEDPLSMLVVGCVGLGLNLLSAGIIHGEMLWLVLFLSLYLQFGWFSDHHGHSHGNGHGHAASDSHIVDLPDKPEVIDMVALERTHGRNSSVGSDDQPLGDIVRTYSA